MASEPKNLTPEYANYFTYEAKNGPLSGENEEYYQFTKHWCRVDGITSVGWFPQRKEAVIHASKDARKQLSKINHTSWLTSDRRLFRVVILPD